MFEIGQPDFKDNVSRKYILFSHIIKENDDLVSFEWAPFPVEMKGVSTILPSPSGLKLLVIRNSINDSPTCFEIGVHHTWKRNSKFRPLFMARCMQMDGMLFYALNT